MTFPGVRGLSRDHVQAITSVDRKVDGNPRARAGGEARFGDHTREMSRDRPVSMV